MEKDILIQFRFEDVNPYKIEMDNEHNDYSDPDKEDNNYYIRGNNNASKQVDSVTGDNFQKELYHAQYSCGYNDQEKINNNIKRIKEYEINTNAFDDNLEHGTWIASLFKKNVILYEQENLDQIEKKYLQ